MTNNHLCVGLVTKYIIERRANMKRLLHIAALLLVLVCMLAACNKYSQGLVYTSNGDGTCYVSRIGNCTDTNISIPPTSPSGDSVTSIGDRAFYDCDSLESIVIPDSVTSIYHEAFYRCDSLESIVIPDSVTSIGNAAFIGCHSLESIVIPDSVTSIGYFAFRNCDSLSNVKIGSGVTSIGLEAFYNCDSLESIVIPDSVTSIGNAAFGNCVSLESIVIPDSVTSIGLSAFAGCDSLSDVYYTGNKGEWAKIEIIGNYELTNATIHYNYIPEE